MMQRHLTALALTLMLASPAHAFTPAVIYGAAGKFDKSFNEAAFRGIAAALASRTGKVGFIGGMDAPLIRNFGCGFAQGAKAVKPSVLVYSNMTGTTSAAFNDPARGGELALSQYDRGADVVFHAAAGTGLGVLQAAKYRNKLAIGVDNNLNHLFPGHVLTSEVKRVDNVVYQVMLDAQQGKSQPGVVSIGLKEGGMDWVLDQHNRALVSPAMEKQINQARQTIIAGKIKVADYRVSNRCPLK